MGARSPKSPLSGVLPCQCPLPLPRNNEGQLPFPPLPFTIFFPPSKVKSLLFPLKVDRTTALFPPSAIVEYRARMGVFSRVLFFFPPFFLHGVEFGIVRLPSLSRCFKFWKISTPPSFSFFSFHRRATDNRALIFGSFPLLTLRDRPAVMPSYSSPPRRGTFSGVGRGRLPSSPRVAV